MRTFFMIVLLLTGIGVTLFQVNAFATLQQSNSAIHEIEVLICTLIVTVAAAAGYIGAVIDKKK